VALTALLLFVWNAPLDLAGQTPEPDPATQPAPTAQPDDDSPPLPADPGAAVDEATNTIRELTYSLYAFLPRILLVLLLVGMAAAVVRLGRGVLIRTLGGWQRTMAVVAVMRLTVFLAAAVATVSILAGDVRAVVGSVGLLGLAASWALQTPIESFTGWLLNSFRSYYRVGDRIAVGEVFGDDNWTASGAGDGGRPPGAEV